MVAVASACFRPFRGCQRHAHQPGQDIGLTVLVYAANSPIDMPGLVTLVHQLLLVPGAGCVSVTTTAD